MYPNYYQPNYTQPNYGQLNYANSGAQQNQPQQGNSIIWVLGENAAKAYPVASGQTVILMDREEPVMYMKSTDQSGMPQPLRIFELHERTAETKQSAVTKSATTEDFVSRKEFEEFREDVKRSIKGMRRHEEEGEG